MKSLFIMLFNPSAWYVFLDGVSRLCFLFLSLVGIFSLLRRAPKDKEGTYITHLEDRYVELSEEQDSHNTALIRMEDRIEDLENGEQDTDLVGDLADSLDEQIVRNNRLEERIDELEAKLDTLDGIVDSMGGDILDTALTLDAMLDPTTAPQETK